MSKKYGKLFFTLLIFILLFALLFLINAKRGVPTNSLDYRTLEKGVVSPMRGSTPSLKLFCSEKEFIPFYRALHLHTLPPTRIPTVDFTTNCVVYISFGEQKSAGYHVQVKAVLQRKQNLIIEAFLVHPPVSTSQVQVITNPYVIISFKKDKWKRIELHNPEGETLATILTD